MNEANEKNEPRMARIRENILGALGPFDVMADIIVGSQHGPVNSGLFGVSPHSLSLAPRNIRSNLSDLTTSQVIQRMQNLVDTPISNIETNLPFKKLRENKAEVSSAKAATNHTSACTSINLVSDNKIVEYSDIHKRNNFLIKDESNQCRKRKRKWDKKEIEGDWQKPCSSGVDNKQEISEDISITINDLFGEDRKRKRTSKESSRNSEEATKMQNKNKEWTKADGESPDSGVQVDETTDSDREQNQISTANLIKEITLISPLLSPPRQPSTHLPHLTYKDGLPSLTCILDLSPLEPMQRSLYMEKIRLNTVAPPRPPLSPPSRPSFNGHISSPKISDMNKSPKITKGFKINGSSLPKNNKDKSKSKPGIKRKDISDAKQKNMEISKRTESPPLIQKVIIKKEPVVRIITPITNYKDSEKNGKIINILKDIKDERSGSSVSNHKESEKDKGKELKLVNEQLSSATNEKSEQKDKLKAKDYCKAKEKDANKRDNDKQKQGNLPISKTVNDLSDSVVNSNSLKEKDGKRNEKLKESNQMRESSIADKSYNYNVIKEMKEKEKSRNKDEISKENRKDLSVTDKNDSLRKVNHILKSYIEKRLML